MQFFSYQNYRTGSVIFDAQLVDTRRTRNYLNENIIVFRNSYPFILKKQEFNKNICKELYLL